MPAARLLAPTPEADRPKLRSPEAFAQWLRERSSLRGVDLDGAWDVDAQGRLQPTVALRRRFDQLLTLAGEAPVDEIAGFIGEDVKRQAGPSAAQQVLDAWQRYVELQRHVFRAQVDPRDPQTALTALAERQQVRRQILGETLAAAFFAEDDTRLQAMLQQRPAVPQPGSVGSIAIDRSSLSPEALERLRREDAAWADWQRRLERARVDVAALRTAPELSELQRRQAIDRLIAERFDGQEAVRARALLQVAQLDPVSSP